MLGNITFITENNRRVPYGATAEMRAQIEPPMGFFKTNALEWFSNENVHHVNVLGRCWSISRDQKLLVVGSENDNSVNLDIFDSSENLIVKILPPIDITTELDSTHQYTAATIVNDEIECVFSSWYPLPDSGCAENGITNDRLYSYDLRTRKLTFRRAIRL